ncbi:MAG: toxic anion resistance protein [Sphingomonadaceae bacterium]|uniref:toxic anion resistance protein n=1 Tax=Thermaurantiacus sp. TaxID=2820283 RepID=UPI00298EE64F|nr:toxic anion resistance protein [Thermaurantiacus sp.]MCS6987305.1 toxic anion resistance protein [Sphingomonadaceae bacterium]MDW8414525.1 toxic anion resistance protein [Thermaurantiacus sp.]
MASDTSIRLKAPEPVKPVAPEAAAGLVPLSDEQKAELEARVDAYVTELVSQDPHSPEFGRRADALANLGQAQIAEAASQSNRFLDRPVGAMDRETRVGADLAELRRTIEDLDPARHDGWFRPRRLLGLIPLGTRVKAYFDRYRSAQAHIAAILDRLAAAKDELLRDNAAIDVERRKLWQTMGRLEQMIHIARTLDARLEAKAIELDATDPAKARALRETALFHVRQRTTDLLTQMAVTVQGYLALDLVKKNNQELLKGVDRASTTTVAALRTAVTVAQALGGQKLVLDQIGALNATTAAVIEETGRLLKEQTGEIHRQAAAATIPLETLKTAFANIYATMDSIEGFKTQALAAMQQTVDALAQEVEKSRGYIARAEGADRATAEPLMLLDG